MIKLRIVQRCMVLYYLMRYGYSLKDGTFF